MVKSNRSMGLSTQQVSIPRPSLMKALTAGFDATSSHLILVIFSIILDSIPVVRTALAPGLHPDCGY